MPAKVFDAFTRLDASDVNAYLANKSISNAIINGAFEINQRGFITVTDIGQYTFDRWRGGRTGGTVTFSAETFTLGEAPVSGYEESNFVRIVTSGQSAAGDFASIQQRVEGVRSFAGQTVTLSFFAKASTGTPSISCEFLQVFGTGGSPSATVITFAAKLQLSTSWQRFTTTITVPSISGKILGSAADYLSLNFLVSAGSDFNARTNSLGIQSNTFDIWGVQLEPGTVANDFRRNANSLEGETAACQRYYFRVSGDGSNSRFGAGHNTTTTVAHIFTPFPVQMRTSPSALEQSGTAANYSIAHANTTTNLSAVPAFNVANKTSAVTTCTVSSGLTAGQGSAGRFTSTSAYLAWDAEI
jgi:hypothetical protein